MEKGTLNWFN